MKHLPLYFATIFALFVSLVSNAQSVTIVKTDGSKSESSVVKLVPQEDYLRLHIPAAELSGVRRLEIRADFATAKVGDPGYFLTPDGFLCHFTQKEEGEFTASHYPLAMWGSSTPAGTYVAIIKGLRYEFKVRESLKDGVYRQVQVFDLRECGAYEDLIVDWYPLEGKDATYSGMGRRYRKYQIDRGEVRPIKERIKANKYLDYAAQAPEIRIRLGWKPVPSPVAEQTLETEPQMYVAATFDKVSEFVDSLKSRGVGKAEICLVGWNVRGHDGRWPTALPVEPALGGEEKLRALISHTQDCGYQIVCHSNATDCYRVSPDLDTNDVALTANGKWKQQGKWSGGNMYQLCQQRSFEVYTPKTHDAIRELGFRGLHYIDVLSCRRPVPCYNPLHPITRAQSAYFETLALSDASSKIGGCQSEGPFDQSASILDYVYKVDLTSFMKNKSTLTDELVPIWQLVYNGIIMSNSGKSGSNNFTIHGPKAEMTVAELASRPTFYINKTFRTGANWSNDLKIGTAQEISRTADAVAKAWLFQQKMAYLQYEFMEEHSTLSESVTRTVFSDGSEIVCNRSSKEFNYRGETVAPGKYRLFKRSPAEA